MRQIFLDQIRGSGAFRRFKHLLHRYAITEEWYEFRTAELGAIPLQWLMRITFPISKRDQQTQREMIPQGQMHALYIEPAPNTRMQSDRFAREIVGILSAFLCSALAAADAQSVGRQLFPNPLPDRASDSTARPSLPPHMFKVRYNLLIA